ncbi:MAG: twin-arginine translocation signal domain-containing protein, partial [Alphaproteobacteria bacterium]
MKPKTLVERRDRRDFLKLASATAPAALLSLAGGSPAKAATPLADGQHAGLRKTAHV